MTKETLLAILKEESMIFTEKELMEMIDEELAKDPSVMDTDFIDLCLDALDGKFDDEEVEMLNQQRSSSRKRLKLSRVLIVAAIIILILSVSIPVCGKYLNLNVKAGVVSVTGDHFEVDMHASDETLEVLSKLEKENLDPVIPLELLKSEYVFDNYRYYDNNDYKTYAFDFENKDINGTITVNSYMASYNLLVGKNYTDNEFENFEQITKNGYEILVFGDKETSYIYYVVDNTEYNIIINSDYSVAYNIAETL